LHIPADCQKAYRVQLAVFRRRCHRPQQQEQQIETIIQSSKNKILHPRLTVEKEEEESYSSDAEDSGDEPLLKKGQTIFTTTALSGGDCCWNVGGNVKNFVLKETWVRKEWKKKIKFAPPRKHNHKNYPKTESVLKNKKSVMETLAMLCSSSTATTTTKEEANNQYFCYHRSSEYSVGPRGKLNQTDDLKR
jgi:hypothetical protein